MTLMPPPDLLMQISNSRRVEDFTGSFPHVRDEVSKYLGRAGFALNQFDSILDFGCSVGRFSYALQPLLGKNQKLYGCDVDARCADWISRNAGYETVVRNELQPPLPWKDGSFDFIYALSVFTHLSLPFQIRWAWELQRLLKRGGVLMCTTHGLGHLARGLSQANAWAQRDCFLIDKDALLAVFSKSGGDAIERQREVASFHNEAAVASQFESLDIRLHDHVSSMAGGQSMNVLVKPDDARSITHSPDLNAKSGTLKVGADLTECAKAAELCVHATFPAPRYDLPLLRAEAIFATASGTPVSVKADFPTPVCLGSHQLFRLKFPAPNESFHAVDLKITDAKNAPVSARWQLASWRS